MSKQPKDSVNKKVSHSKKTDNDGEESTTPTRQRVVEQPTAAALATKKPHHSENKSSQEEGEAHATATPLKSEASSAVVVAPTTAVVKRLDKTETTSLRNSYMTYVNNSITTATNDVVEVSRRGVTVPAITATHKVNKDGFQGSISYSARVTFGSTANMGVCNCAADPAGNWVLIPIVLSGKTGAALPTYPVSPTTGHQVKHALIRRGDVRTVITSNKDVMLIPPMSIVYCVWTTPVLSVGQPSAVPARKRKQHVEEALEAYITQHCSQQPPKHHVAGQVATTVGVPIATAQPMATPAQPTPLAMSTIQPCGVLAEVKDTSTFDASVYGSGAWSVTNLQEIVHAISIADCEAFSSGLVHDIALKAYLASIPGASAQATSAQNYLTREQCICMELMHPDIIPVQIPIAAGPTAKLKFIYRCPRVVPAVPSDYINQSQADMIAYARECTAETIVTYENVVERKEMFAIHAVPRDVESSENGEYQQYVDDRVGALECSHPVINTVEYGLKQVKGNDGNMRSILKCKPSSGETTCLRFTAHATTWTPGTAFRDATSVNGKFDLSATCKTFDGVVEALFDISSKSTELWESFAPVILPNTHAWYWMVIDTNSTECRGENIGRAVRKHSATINANVMMAVADVPTLLRTKIGIPITLSAARALLQCGTPMHYGTHQPATAGSAYRMGLFACLTNSPEKILNAIAADCEFYVITSSPYNWRTRGVQMTPDLGSVMLLGDWCSNNPVTVPGFSTPFEVTHPWRDVESMKLAHPSVQKCVFAVRRETGGCAWRAKMAMSVYTDGGSYNANGSPLTIISPPPQQCQQQAQTPMLIDQ